MTKKASAGLPLKGNRASFNKARRETIDGLVKALESQLKDTQEDLALASKIILTASPPKKREDYKG